MLFFAVLTVLLSSCKKNYNEILPSNKNMTDLVVSDDFNWKTSVDIEILITGSTNGVIRINSIDGANYHKGMVASDVEYKTKITIPTYVNKVQIIYSGKTEVVTIINNKIEFTM